MKSPCFVAKSPFSLWFLGLNHHFPMFFVCFCMFLYVFVVVDADFQRRWSLFLAICVRVFADAGEPKKGGKKLR